MSTVADPQRTVIYACLSSRISLCRIEILSNTVALEKCVSEWKECLDLCIRVEIRRIYICICNIHKYIHMCGCIYYMLCIYAHGHKCSNAYPFDVRFF